MPGKKPRHIRCPTCGVSVKWDSKERWRPFCSERCKLIDLGNWFDETNRIPGETSPPGPAPKN